MSIRLYCGRAEAIRAALPGGQIAGIPGWTLDAARRPRPAARTEEVPGSAGVARRRRARRAVAAAEDARRSRDRAAAAVLAASAARGVHAHRSRPRPAAGRPRAGDLRRPTSRRGTRARARRVRDADRDGVLLSDVRQAGRRRRVELSKAWRLGEQCGGR